MRWLANGLAALLLIWAGDALGQVGVDGEHSFKNDTFMAIYDFREESRDETRQGEIVVYTNYSFPESVKLTIRIEDGRIRQATLAVARNFMREEEAVDKLVMEMSGFFLEQLICPEDAEPVATLQRLLSTCNAPRYVERGRDVAGMEVFLNRRDRYEEELHKCGVRLVNV